LAHPMDGGAEIRRKEDERLKIGADFKNWIEGVERARTKRNVDVWQKAFDNYEQTARIKQFPWPGASNARIPITPSHSNPLAARIYNAATAQEPGVIILAGRQGNIIEEGQFDEAVSYEWWAQRWAKIAEWVEKAEIEVDEMLDELILTFVLYGDAFIYLPWEVEEVMDVEMGRGGELKKTPRTLIDRPVPKVLHPKDVIIAHFEKSVQSARRVGVHGILNLPKIDEFEAQGIYTSKMADKLREKLDAKKSHAEESKKVRGNFAGTYYKEWGGSYMSNDEFQRQVDQRIGVDPDEQPNALTMVRVFARADLDDDGVPEEVIYDVEKEEGLVPYARYNNILHRQRPLVHFYFEKRPGSIYNRGVPEMLMNIQKILDTSVRDLLDNNKVRNTKVFVGRKGGPLEANTKLYPGRLFLLNNPREDLQALDLGSGTINTTVNDIALMQQWGERLTGVTDFNLGQERRSRTPATTTLALLEETNKRIDKTIRVFRKGMKEFWFQTLQLYLQNGDPEILAKVSAQEQGDEEKFIAAWSEVNVEDFRRQVEIQPEISSAALNQTILRQEKLALFQQAGTTQERTLALANSIGGSAADPAMEQLFVIFAKATHRAMNNVLDTFSVRDRKEFNPDIIKLLENVTSVPLEAEDGATETGRSNPAQAAAGLVANQPSQLGEQAARGESIPGSQRIPGPTPGS